MKKKKWRDVKNALVMVVVMAAMMSTATYAWFTLTSNATVTGMQMTAGGSSGLKVSTDNTNWYDAVSLEQKDAETDEVISQVINQVTVKAETDGSFLPNFYKPNYGNVENDLGETVTGVTDVVKIDESVEPLTNYLAKYTYYLKTESETSANVGIVIAPTPAASTAVGLNGGEPLVNGSFVREVGASSTNTAANAVRVGIVVDGKMYVYEPNNGASNNGSGAESDYVGTYTPTVVSNATGNITGGVLNTPSETNEDSLEVSQTLFAVNNTGKEVTMYVWLEGTDADCVDEIKADDIEAQIQFTIVD